MEVIQNVRGIRTHSVLVREVKTGKTKSFSVSSKESLDRVFEIAKRGFRK